MYEEIMKSVENEIMKSLKNSNNTDDSTDNDHSDDGARSDVSFRLLRPSSDYCGRPIRRHRDLSYSRSPRTSDDDEPNDVSPPQLVGAKASISRITGDISKMEVSAKQPRLD